ncbi:hypothetical protein R6L23_08260 [Streptomyces sp. SR27]|uniref:hypothetical protein n=1 Tax=Streptomyces sp. SR27 TaxID=3076630 RepID=UPI00295AE65A|nr:hypothetical protein [Streptomyces sp. SR27]MDV9188208.1 hypothetical protein [Streptomyces sp. SR27]
MTAVLHEPAPSPRLWTADENPAVLGFTPVLGGLHITGLPAPDAEPGSRPGVFLLFGHHRWATAIHAAALYMQRVHAWTRWCLYLGDDPDDVIPRIPRAVHAHATIHCHSDETWHLAWARPDEPGAIPVTAMWHPAALAATGAMPDPDQDPKGALWAR